MKTRINTFMLAGLLLLSASCKDDEPEITAELVGQWQGDDSELKVTYGLIILYEEDDEQFDAVLDFKEDGTVTFTDDGTTSNGTYERNGSRLTTNVDFQVQGVELNTVTFDIVELTTTRLVLHIDQDHEVEVPDVGLVTTNIKGDFTFNRL